MLYRIVLYCIVLCIELYMYEVEPDSDEDAGYDDLYSTDNEAAEEEEEESGTDCGCDGREVVDNSQEYDVAVSG